MSNHKEEPFTPILNSTKNNNQAGLWLAWINPTAAHDTNRSRDLRKSGHLLSTRRRKKIVKLLNEDHPRIGDVSGFEFLKPLGADIGAPSDFGSRQVASSEQIVGSIEKGHSVSIGKTLPFCQAVPCNQPETLYRDWPVIFSRMRTEKPEDVPVIVSDNVKRLKGDRSHADLLGKDQRNVGNTINQANSPKLDTLVRIAHSLGVETWQLLVRDASDLSPTQLLQLSQVVRGFVKLGSRLQQTLGANVENEARGQGRLSEIIQVPLPKTASSSE